MLLYLKKNVPLHADNRWFNMYSFPIKYHVHLWDYFQHDFVDVNSSDGKIKYLKAK